jgi:hypothetical protein
MLKIYLFNILIFCGILLLLVLTVAVVQMVLILVDIRKVAGETRKKALALVSAIDIASLKIALIALAAGLRKVFNVLFSKRRHKNG